VHSTTPSATSEPQTLSTCDVRRFFPPTALKIFAKEYLQDFLDCLNEQILVKGAGLSHILWGFRHSLRRRSKNQTVAQVVFSTAPNESQTLTFNCASLSQQQLSSPSPCSLQSNHLSNNSNTHTSSETTSIPCAEPQIRINRQAAQPSSAYRRYTPSLPPNLAPLPISKPPSPSPRKALTPEAARAGLSASSQTCLAASASSPLKALARSLSQSADSLSRRMVLNSAASTSPPRPWHRTSFPRCRRRRRRSRVGTSARSLDERMASAHCLANVWSDPALLAADAGAPTDSVGMYGSSEAPATLDALGHTLYALFCVSVHENAWMAVGYSVWGMERFWTCLDWAAVWEAYAQYAFLKQVFRVRSLSAFVSLGSSFICKDYVLTGLETTYSITKLIVYSLHPVMENKHVSSRLALTNPSAFSVSVSVLFPFLSLFLLIYSQVSTHSFE
jgi:hypothetical protein